MPYEDGMKILWDSLRQEVVVTFRDTVTVLPGKFESSGEAIGAGEQCCRSFGWGGRGTVFNTQYSLEATAAANGFRELGSKERGGDQGI